MELDVTLRNCHWFWALLHGAEHQLNEATLSVTPVGRRSAAGSFARIFRLENPTGDETAEFAFVAEMWQRISSGLGIIRDEGIDKVLNGEPKNGILSLNPRFCDKTRRA
jgi:hypothetical protein